jgi:hypothetical protein
MMHKNEGGEDYAYFILKQSRKAIAGQRTTLDRSRIGPQKTSNGASLQKGK